MADVDVVIVNYHSAALAHNCVRSVHETARADGVEVDIVVVNNSDDGAALADAVTRAGGAAILQNARNLGFGAACNLGAERGKAPVMLFLNPDAVLQPGCLRAVLDAFNQPDLGRVGIVGPALSNLAGAPALSCSALPTAGSLIGRTIGLHVLVPGLSFPFLSPAVHAHSGDVGQVMGAVMFVRRETFAAVGGFDPAYFLYYEDVELAARAAVLGWRTYYLASARAGHAGAGSSVHASGMALALHAASRSIYARRHFGPGLAALVLIASVLVEFPGRLLRTLLATGEAGQVLTGWRLLLGWAVFGADIAAAAGRPRTTP
jgi:GT2 family glycosyltransferase